MQGRRYSVLADLNAPVSPWAWCLRIMGGLALDAADRMYSAVDGFGYNDIRQDIHYGADRLLLFGLFFRGPSSRWAGRAHPHSS